MIFTPTEDIPILTSTPTYTPIVVPPASDAIYYYYSQVSLGNYETTWNLLSDTYKATVNATGFEPYKEYWSSVDKVIVSSANTAFDDGKTAIIMADLIYYYLDGRVVSANGREIDMVYDTQRHTWLINATP